MTDPHAPLTSPSRLGLTICLFGIVIGFTILLIVGGAWSGVYLSSYRVVLVVVGFAGSIAWLVIAQWRGRWLPRSALTWAIAASLLAFSVSGFAAWQPRLGFEYIAYVVLLTASYLLLVRIWDEPFYARRLDVLLPVVTLAIGVLYLAQVMGRWLVFWERIGRFAVPPLRPDYAGLWLGQPNAIAALLVLLFLASALGLRTASPARRAAVGGVGLVVIAAVFVSGSRGAWLGLGCAGVAGVLSWVVRSGSRNRLQSLLRNRRLRFWLAVVAPAMVAIAVLLGPAIYGRIAAGAFESRTSFWAVSLRMFESAPWTGLGPGSWTPARLVFSGRSDFDEYVPHAHDVPVQVLAEFGLVGVLASLAVVGSLAWLIWRGLRSSSPTTGWTAWVTLLAVTYLAGQQLVDAYVHQPGVLLAIALPIARLDALVSSEQHSGAGRPIRSRLVSRVLLVAVVVATLAALSVEGSAVAQERAADAANSGDWGTAMTEAAGAARGDPNIATYHLTAGLAAAHLGELEIAASELERAAFLDDYPTAWLDLAAVRLQTGDAPGAREALDRALRVGINEPQVVVAGAGLARELGDRVLAESLLAAAFTTAPSLAADPFWASDGWAGISEQARTEARDRLGNSWYGFLLALELGDIASAEAMAPQFAGLEGEEAALAALAWAGDVNAFERLRADVRSRPLDAIGVSLCRRVAEVRRAAGDPSATCDDAGWTDVYLVVRIGHPRPGQTQLGSDPYFHAIYAYRRVGPRDLFVPGVLRLETSVP